MASKINKNLPLTPYLQASFNYVKDLTDTYEQYKMIIDRLYWLELCSEYLNEITKNKKEYFFNQVQIIDNNQGYIPSNLNTKKLFSLIHMNPEIDETITILKINTKALYERIEDFKTYISNNFTPNYNPQKPKNYDYIQPNKKPTLNQVISHLISSLDTDNTYKNN
ncbi:MAG: hypothetical protein K0B07_04110 [DPANN group archaeon]|nr:hypothetical protein [DPANN group archaeon]